MMSLALEINTGDRIQRSEFVHGMNCARIYDSSDSGCRGFPSGDEVDSCSSSSIGKNSDASGEASDGEGDYGDGEVQSSFKGPLNSLDGLEQVLPIKRGISTFYHGKSKSFTSLADAASCSSIRDIAKPEDAYTRKRKNLVAHNNFYENRLGFSLSGNGGGMSKRMASSSKSTLALGVTKSRYDNNDESENPYSISSSPHLSLPPLPPQSRRLPNNESSSSPARLKTPWRSFSLSDLQHAAGAAVTPAVAASLIHSRGEKNFNRGVS